MFGLGEEWVASSVWDYVEADVLKVGKVSLTSKFLNIDVNKHPQILSPASNIRMADETHIALFSYCI